MPDVIVLDVKLHDRVIGTITRLPDDRNVFTFDAAYAADPDRPTLSLSFKDVYGKLLHQHAPTQTRLLPFFSNLLPEGSLRDYLAQRAGVKPQREFFLAWALGCDLPGAVRLTPRDASVALPNDAYDDPDKHADPKDTPLRFSLAGVQLKFSALQTGSGRLTIPVNGTGGSWIIKLPSLRLQGVPENEFAVMELARHVGIEVPETKLVPIRNISGLPSGIEIAGDTAFAIKRFDRAPNGERIHIEDFAQIFGIYPEKKYDRASYGNLAKVLWIETGELGVTEFIRRLVFNALIGNADMHLKNWSLIYPDARTPRLSPAYDFVATVAYLPDDKLALSFAGSKAYNTLTRDQFLRFAAKAQLPEKLTLDTMEETVSRFSAQWRTSKDTLNPKLRTAIRRHLKTIPIWNDIAAP